MTENMSTAVRGRGSLGRSMLSIGLAASALAVAATGALFTDSASVGANTFATGNVELTATATDAEIVAKADMAPGDVETGSVTVANAGSLELRYAVTSTTGEDVLAAQIDLTVWDEADETTVDDTCDSTAPTTTLYAPGDLGSVAGTPVIGDTTQGGQAGDQILAANTDQLLCFRAELPSATGNEFESLTTTATFAFNAEQTANNT